MLVSGACLVDSIHVCTASCAVLLQKGASPHQVELTCPSRCRVWLHRAQHFTQGTMGAQHGTAQHSKILLVPIPAPPHLAEEAAAAACSSASCWLRRSSAAATPSICDG